MAKETKENLYEHWGASSSKEELHSVLHRLQAQSPAQKSSYPSAFCQLYPDKNNDSLCLLHTDGCGTKSSLAYLYWRETDELSVFADLAEDALVMNLDDALCTGASQGPYYFVNSLARNKDLIPAEVLEAIIFGFAQGIKRLNDMGAEAYLCGGETADMGDVIRTLFIDATLYTRLRHEDVIDNGKLRPGDILVGLGSEGTTAYDKRYNSGIGSNGLTLARHTLFNKDLALRYPESYDSLRLSAEEAYQGPYALTDPLDTPDTLSGGITLGRAALSPTRTYFPLLKKVLERHHKDIHALVHCTGGGLVKSLEQAKRKQLCIIKDNLFDIPPIFKAIQEAGNISWREMYQTFNMGQRMELYVADEKTAEAICCLANELRVPARIMGRVEKASDQLPAGIQLTLPKEAGADPSAALLHYH